MGQAPVVLIYRVWYVLTSLCLQSKGVWGCLLLSLILQWSVYCNFYLFPEILTVKWSQLLPLCDLKDHVKIIKCQLKIWWLYLKVDVFFPCSMLSYILLSLLFKKKKTHGILGVVQQVSLKLGHVLNLVSAFSQLCHRKRTVIRFSPMMHSQ